MLGSGGILKRVRGREGLGSGPLLTIATLALKMETECFSETLVSTYESTRRQNPKDNTIILTAVKTSNPVLKMFLKSKNQMQMCIEGSRGQFR
jgi:hypothetical protein